LALWTHENTWFSNEVGKKGKIKVGQLADLVLLSDDYFKIPEQQIAHIRSVLTVLGGKVVHGDAEFRNIAPDLPPPMPDWSPVRSYGGYFVGSDVKAKLSSACGCATTCAVHGHDHAAALGAITPVSDLQSF